MYHRLAFVYYLFDLLIYLLLIKLQKERLKCNMHSSRQFATQTQKERYSCCQKLNFNTYFFMKPGVVIEYSLTATSCYFSSTLRYVRSMQRRASFIIHYDTQRDRMVLQNAYLCRQFNCFVRKVHNIINDSFKQQSKVVPHFAYGIYVVSKVIQNINHEFLSQTYLIY